MDRPSFLFLVRAVLPEGVLKPRLDGIARLGGQVSQRPLAVPAFTVQNGHGDLEWTRRATTMDRAEIGRISRRLRKTQVARSNSQGRVRTRPSPSASEVTANGQCGRSRSCTRVPLVLRIITLLTAFNWPAGSPLWPKGTSALEDPCFERVMMDYTAYIRTDPDAPIRIAGRASRPSGSTN